MARFGSEKLFLMEAGEQKRAGCNNIVMLDMRLSMP